MSWGDFCGDCPGTAEELSAVDASAFPFVEEREDLFIMARNNLNCHSEPIR
jgi:hypothetical protein